MDKSKLCNPLFNKQQQRTSTSENNNKNKKLNTENNNKNKKTALSKKQLADLPEYTGITAKEVN